jgi:hypothetical protein
LQCLADYCGNGAVDAGSPADLRVDAQARDAISVDPITLADVIGVDAISEDDAVQLVDQIGPGDRADVATTPDTGSPDLGPPADAGLTCTRIVQPFTSAASDWVLLGSATLDPQAGRLDLNAVAEAQAGGAYYGQALTTAGFALDFDYTISNAGAAGAGDGMTFTLLAETADQAQPRLGPGTGGGLGVMGLEGYAVELDTFQNDGLMGEPLDTDGNHVAWVTTQSLTEVVAAAVPFPLHCDCERHAHIVFDGLRLQVSLDGMLVLDAPIQGFIPGRFWLGFTAATGGNVERHAIRNVSLLVGPSGTCF